MPNPIATFTTTQGEIKCEIYLDKMPITASNFIDLANSGFYNGLHFHRVIPDVSAKCESLLSSPPFWSSLALATTRAVVDSWC